MSESRQVGIVNSVLSEEQRAEVSRALREQAQKWADGSLLLTEVPRVVDAVVAWEAFEDRVRDGEQSNAIRDAHSSCCVEELTWLKQNRRRMAYRWYLGETEDSGQAMKLLEEEERLFGKLD